jgi:hypothetical protein
MTTSTLEAPVKTAVATPATIAPSRLPVTADTIDFSAIFAKIKNDPWLWAKLLVLAGCASPAAYAIGWSLTNESFGVSIAIIPDMLAAGALLIGILGCTLFFDEDHTHA